MAGLPYYRHHRLTDSGRRYQGKSNPGPLGAFTTDTRRLLRLNVFVFISVQLSGLINLS